MRRADHEPARSPAPLATPTPAPAPKPKASPSLPASAAHSLQVSGDDVQSGGTSRDLVLDPSAGTGSVMVVNSSDLMSLGSTDQSSTTAHYLDAARRYPGASEAELWAEAVRRDANTGGTVLTAAAPGADSPARAAKGSPFGGSLIGLPAYDTSVAASSTAVARPAQLPEARHQKRAFVVGNGDYQADLFHDLAGATRDAQSMASRYEGQGYKVSHDEDLTASDLKATMKATADGLAAGDDVIFYYAGHAYGNDLYGVDAKGATGTSRASGVASAGPLHSAAASAVSQGAHLQVIIDACNSSPIADKTADTFAGDTLADQSRDLPLSPEQEARRGLSVPGRTAPTTASLRADYQKNLAPGGGG